MADIFEDFERSDNFNDDDITGDPSLASILAEVKGSAFINGEKKTPPDILQKKADRILREAAAMSGAPAPSYSSSYSDSQEDFPTQTNNWQQTDTESEDPFGVMYRQPSEPTYKQSPERTYQQSQAEFFKQPSEMPQSAQSVQSNQQTPHFDFEQNDEFGFADSGFNVNDFSDTDFPDISDTPMIVTPPENESRARRAEAPFVPVDSGFGEPQNSHQEQATFAHRRAQAQEDWQQDTVVRRHDEPQDNWQQDTVVRRRDEPQDNWQQESFARRHDEPQDSWQQDAFVHRRDETQDSWQQDTVARRHDAPRPMPQEPTATTTLFDFDQESPDFVEKPSYTESFDDEDYIEPDLSKVVKRFANECNSISLRVVPAALITFLMLMITFVFEGGLVMPFGIGHSLFHTAGLLIMLLLIVMMLCCDILFRGVNFLLKGAPNAETIILISCVFSIFSAMFTMFTNSAQMLPFCAVAAMSLTFAAFGEKYSLQAITETLKTASGTSNPFGVQSEFNVSLDRSVLKKTYNRTDGFYSNLMQPDITEILYSYATPTLVLGSVVLTIIVVIFSGEAGNSLHILSALLAAAAPFSMLLSFSIPFATVAKTARNSGAAIAGWGGTDDICNSDGVCVSDDDLFPPGMLRLSGGKVYDGASSDEAIKYTACLIISSGSGLSSLFSEVLKQQELPMEHVDNFECHESGVSGIINGDTVISGSAAFMNLQGVRVPDDTTMKNAIYTSIRGKLVAMFIIDYKPLPSVQNALIDMIRWRIDLYFAMRDFNVTPAMVGQKFKVPFDSFVFIPAKDSYTISDMYSGKEGRMAAVLARDGLGPFAEAITGGRLLRSASLFATALSSASAALGILIMFYMTWTGAFVSASPGNLAIFMLCMLATVLIVCGYVKLKK